MDAEAMHEATARLAEHVRTGGGPVFLEAICYRFRGHSMADPEFYRNKEEVARWRHLDPIEQLRRRMTQAAELDDESFEHIQAQVDAIAEEAARFAEESPDPALETLDHFVYKGDARA